MSQNYLAWNGEEYPWPPPEGWYEASDGRWWAPNSGPGPKQDSHVSENPTRIDDPISDVSDSDPTSKQPLVDPNASPYFDRPAATGPTQQQPFTASLNPGLSQPEQQFAPNPTTPQQQFGSSPAPGFDQPEYAAGQSYRGGASGGGRDNSKLLLIIGGVAAFLLIGVLSAFLLIRGSGETTEAAESTTTTAAEAATTTTVESTTTAEPTTTTAPVDRQAALRDFRNYIAGIDVVGLDDANLNSIGDEACRFGSQSADNAEWNEQLDNTVANIQSQQEEKPPAVGTPLTEEAIRGVYEGALFYYCPAEAERLGVVV